MKHIPQLILDSSLPYLEDLAREVGEVTTLASRDFSPERVAQADALLIRSVVHCDAALLSGSRVRMIATATAGYDHIDGPWCDAAGIAWRNAPGCNAGGVVQYVLSSLAAWSLERGVDLEGLTLGIVGVGHVGGRLAERASALGLRVLLCDPPRAEREGGEGFLPLEALLEQSDIVTLHVPLIRAGRYATAGMVDEGFLAHCSRRPLLINACRGGVAPTAQLLRGLESGQLRDLILDCWEGEPEISAELARRAFIATPHVAGWTADGKWRGSRMALAAVCEVLELPEPRGLWDSSVLPQPEEPVLDLNSLPEGERILRAQLHSADPRSCSRLLQAEPERFAEIRHDYVFPREASAYTLRGVRPEERAALERLGFRVQD